MKRKILESCLNLAHSELHKHSEPYCHYSFIIQRNRILGYGTNKTADAYSKTRYPSYSKIHSEPDAYFNLKILIDPKFTFDVVNIRLTKTGVIRNSKPCKCCNAFLRVLNCNCVWYSTDDANFARLDFK